MTGSRRRAGTSRVPDSRRRAGTSRVPDSRRRAGTSRVPDSTRPAHPRVYLAGPEVFLSNAHDVGVAKKALCARHGLVGVYPADNDVPTAPVPASGYAIAKTNEALIDTCHLVVANMTPFRGPSADVGTAYEMGYARGRGLPVFAYSTLVQDFATRTAHKVATVRDADGSLRDPNGLLIESFGLTDNVMLDYAVRDSGATIVVPPEPGAIGPDGSAPSADHYGRLGEFERCLALVVEALRDL